MTSISFEDATSGKVSFEQAIRPARTTFEEVTLSLQRGVSGMLFGNDPSAPGVQRRGKLARTGGGDFIELPDGTLQAFSNLDFIAEDETGELAVFSRSPDETIKQRAKRAADTVTLGVAGSVLPRVGRAISAAEKAESASTTSKVASETAPTLNDLQARINTVNDAPLVDKAGNINLNRIFAPDDVKAVIDAIAKKNDFADARRGVVSQEQTREMAALLNMTPETLAQRTAGQAFNAEEMFAARELLVSQADEVTRLAKIADGGSDLDKAKFSEAMARLTAIQEQVSGATAEAGRTLQQFRILASASKEQIARLVDAGDAGGVDEIIKRVQSLDDPQQVATFVNDAMKATTSDKLLELWINALLSGPTTQATNILSNTLVSLWSIPETALAAGISKVTGSGIRAKEITARAYGVLEGAKDGLRAGTRAFLTEEPSNLAGKIEVRKQKAIPGIVGKTVRIPGRALLAGDEFFKAIGYRQEINALAYRTALNEGLTGKALAQRVSDLRARPTQEMIEAGRKTAELQTFTNPLGKDGRALIAWSNRNPWAKVIVPFIRTPVNIVKFAVQRSPLAPLFKEVRKNLSGANGAVARDTQIARIGVGSAVGAAAAYFAAEGGLTGQGPTDPRERALLYAQGWQPYSIKVGDEYYSFSRLEPFGTLLGVSADFVELSNHASDEEKNNIASLMIGSISKNLTSKTFLSGLTAAIEAYNEPERYGANWVQRLASTVVPTGLAQVARTRDPFLREARTTLDKIKSRIPGQRENLQLRRDVFGEPIELGGAVGPDILSPIYKSRAKDEPVAAELLRLKVLPGKPRRQIQGVELTDEEYEALQIAIGQSLKQRLGALIENENWSKIPDEIKRDAVRDVMRLSGNLGRASVRAQFPELRERILESKRAQFTQTP